MSDLGMALTTLLRPSSVQKVREAGTSALAWTREDTLSNAREYAGRRYGESRDKLKRPVNVISESMLGLIPSLSRKCEIRFVPRTPLVSAAAKVMTAKLNLLRDRMGMQDLERDVVTDSLVAPFGIVRVGLEDAGSSVNIDSQPYNVSRVCVERVDWADWVQDPTAKHRSAVRWRGDRYRVHRDAAIEAMVFGHDPAEVGTLPAAAMTYDEAMSALGRAKTVEQTNTDDGDRARILDEAEDAYELADLVEVWRIAIRDIGGKTWIVHLLDDDKDQTQFLRITPYHGWGNDPYELLHYMTIPGSPLPQSHANVLWDTHESSRIISNKIVTDAEESKQVAVVSAGAGEKTYLRLTKAKHRAGIVGDPNSAKVVAFTSMLKDLAPALGLLRQSANQIGGNPQFRGGGGMDADTATESQLVAGQSQERDRDMLDQVTGWRMRVAQRMAFYELDEPVANERIGDPQANGDVYELENSPELRSGVGVEDFETRVEVDQDFATDPAVEKRRFMELLAQGIPAIVQAAQMGVVDARKALDKFGNCLGMDDLGDIAADPQMQMEAVATQQQARGQAPGQAPAPGRAPGGGMGMGPKYDSGLGVARGALSMGVPA